MQKKKNLIMMCGAPGLGKSTWIQNHLNTFGSSYKIVSRDNIRFSLVSKDEDYFSHEDEVWNIFISQIKEGLKENDIVIADATHLNFWSRKKLLNAIGKKNLEDIEIIIIVMRGSVQKALNQNENRKGTRSYVPEAVIRNMYKNFSMPHKNEGFDKIYTVTNGKITERISI